MEIINLTPHAITFVRDSGENLTINPSGELARVSFKTEQIGEVDGIPVTKTVYGDVTGLPEKQDGKIFLVSSLVASRVFGRDDVFIPNDSVRDAEGRIIGCKSLGRVN